MGCLAGTERHRAVARDLVHQVDLPRQVGVHRLLDAGVAVVGAQIEVDAGLVGRLVRSLTSGRPNARQASVPPSSTCTSALVRAAHLLHRQPRQHAVGRGDHHMLAPASGEASAASRVRTPQSAPGMWPSRKSTLRARSTTTVPSPLSSRCDQPGHVDASARRRPVPGPAGVPSGGADRVQAAVDDEHVAVAHLAQPRAGHARAHAGVVQQHDARVAHADPAGRSPAPAGRPAR